MVLEENGTFKMNPARFGEDEPLVDEIYLRTDTL